MRPILPERSPRRSRGVTLIEMVVAIVLVAIVVGATLYFALPVRQAADLAIRAELTDAADNALQRMARDLRLALPNSVRLAGGNQYVEFLAVHTAGRYRADGYGTGAPVGATCDGVSGDSDQLAFDIADGCFKPIGVVPATISDASGHRLVLNNYGQNFAGQNAYEAVGSADRNWRAIDGTATAGSNDRVRFTPATDSFKRPLHDSPGRRFFIISGPVTYACDTTLGELRRYSGYAIQATQPTSGMGSGNVIAKNVSACAFEYEDGVAPQIGLLTVTLTLSKAISGGGAETVRLFHAIHVRNVP